MCGSLLARCVDDGDRSGGGGGVGGGAFWGNGSLPVGAEARVGVRLWRSIDRAVRCFFFFFFGGRSLRGLFGLAIDGDVVAGVIWQSGE